MNPNTENARMEIDFEALTARALSLRARVGHIVLLLIALAMAIVVFSLLVTEPALPVRTQVAFGVLLVAALAWVGYAVFVLARRHTLLVSHRVVAAALALIFSTLFTVGALLVGLADGANAAYVAAGLGAALAACATGLLVQSLARRNRLIARRNALKGG